MRCAVLKGILPGDRETLLSSVGVCIRLLSGDRESNSLGLVEEGGGFGVPSEGGWLVSVTGGWSSP